ncbi:conserved hypothetical protein [metagenome]|uniref:Uncharacterized protein n=1 Tax=metagenome TaxID=256318 RepID=A0A2P2C2Y4_9ZZZZ
MSVRCYLPATLDDLASLVAGGALGLAEAFEAPDDTEEGEYAALTAAAEAAAPLVAGGVEGRRRRVVVVAEVEPATLAGSDATVSLGEVVAVHVDTHDDAPLEEDLAWFATQEIPSLL